MPLGRHGHLPKGHFGALQRPARTRDESISWQLIGTTAAHMSAAAASSATAALASAAEIRPPDKAGAALDLSLSSNLSMGGSGSMGFMAASGAERGDDGSPSEAGAETGGGAASATTSAGAFARVRGNFICGKESWVWGGRLAGGVSKTFVAAGLIGALRATGLCGETASAKASCEPALLPTPSDGEGSPPRSLDSRSPPTDILSAAAVRKAHGVAFMASYMCRREGEKSVSG